MAALAKVGDHQAFQALVNAHGRRLFAACYRVLLDKQLAEDAVQEAFIKIHRNLAHFDGRAQFGTWAYTIAMNTAIDMQRKLKRQNETALSSETSHQLSGGQTPESAAGKSALNDLIHESVAALSDKTRTAFVLKHWHGHSIEEISEMLSINPNTVKNRIFRAVAELRETIQPLVKDYDILD